MKFFATNTDTMIEVALHCAELNLPVFPADYAPDGQISGVLHISGLNKHTATISPEEIRKIWETYSSALVSVPTGKKSGLIVVRVAEHGQTAWKRWASVANLDIKSLACQETPESTEYIFKAPAPGKTIYSAMIEEGIEILGEKGSFVIAPGVYRRKDSRGRKIEKKYAVIADFEPTDIPEGLLDKILETKAGVDPNAELKKTLKRLEAEAKKPLKTAEWLKGGAIEADYPDGIEPDDIREGEPSSQEEEEEAFATDLPKLPMNALPKRLAKLISGVSEVFCVDEWLPFAAAVKTASSIVGANVVLDDGRQTNPGHTWLCLVGSPSIGKSQITGFFGRPVFEMEKTFCQRYAYALDEYKAELKEMAAQEAEDKKRGEKNRRKEPKPPVKTTIYVDDITPESLVHTLAQNPGGVSWDCDEIRALLSSFGRYGGKGSGEAAKSRLLSMYSGSPVKVDRKGAEASLFVPNAWLSIFGTVQPSILPKIFGKEDMDSGFLQRFMFIHSAATPPTPRGQRPKLDKYSGFVSEIFGGLAAQVKRLCPAEREGFQGESEESRPRVITLEADACEPFNAFIDQIDKKAFYLSEQGEAADEARSRAGRWGEQFPRLLLLIHCLESSAGGYDEVGKTIKVETVMKTRAIFTALMEHSVSAWEKIKGVSKEAPKTELLEIIDKYIEKDGKLYEIHFAKTTPSGQKIADAILEEIGTAENGQTTRQALSKSIEAMGFKKGKTAAGNKYSISQNKYEKLMKILEERQNPVQIKIEPAPAYHKPDPIDVEIDAFLEALNKEKD